MTNQICDKTAQMVQKTNIVQKMHKSNINFLNLPKNATKKRKITTLLTFSTKQRKILQRFHPR